MRIQALLSSILIHSLGAFTLWAATYYATPEVAGSSGLRGSPYAGMLIEVSPLAPRSQQVTKASARTRPVSEGIPVAAKLQTELPEETKAEPRMIEDEVLSAQAKAEAVAANAEREEATPSEQQPGNLPGQRGQGGSSDQFAAQLGNGSRTNAMGLYLARVADRIQKHLRSPGMLEDTHTAQMQIVIQTNGHVDDITVRQSTGDRKLDLLAIDAIRRAEPFDPTEQELRVNIPVVFRLRN